MRVVQIVNHFFPSVGGTQLATYHLAEHLAQLDVDVKIFTFNMNPVSQLKNGFYSSNLPSFEKIGEIDVYRFPVFYLGKTNTIKLLSTELCKILISPSAIKRILREKPDIIHFQGANEVLQAILTFYASTFSKCKKVLTVHGLHAQIELFRNKRFLKYINEQFLRLALGKANHVVALSKTDTEQLKSLKIPRDKVSIIPNGIDLSKYSVPNRKHLHRTRSSNPIILCVSRINEKKGIEVLIKAAAQVVSKRPKVKFVVVGGCTNSYFMKLNRLVKKLGLEKNVIFKGHIPHESTYLLDLYRRASVFVLPSLIESLPLVLLEAMASGLPIVASRIGGIPDLISPSEGILFAPGDVSGLSSSLLFLLENNSIRTNLGKNSRRKIENYSWQRIAEETMTLYEKLLVTQ